MTRRRSVFAGMALLAVSGATATANAQVRSSAIHRSVPTSGLIGHWPLNGNARDTSGHGHNGTIVGATSIAHGVRGRAYSFDGSDYIDVGNLAFGSSSFSVSLWLKSQTVASASNYRDAISKLDINHGGPFAIGDGYDNPPAYTGPFALTWNGGIGEVNIAQRALTLKDGRWHMVTYTYKNGGQALYVDGAKMRSFNFAGPLPTNTDHVRIGGYEFGAYHHPWTGSIDDVLIYGRVLSPVEVLKIYQSFAPPPS